MTPRSRELFRSGQEALAGSEVLLSSGLPGRAVSDAYYAMLYAARAALSEVDRQAKTHAGVWGLFYETFVATGAFDRDLYSSAHAAQEQREDVDYAAAEISREEAADVIAVAREFVRVVRSMFDEDHVVGEVEPEQRRS